MYTKYAAMKVREIFGRKTVRGDVGIEIELEGRGLGVEATGWLLHAEGSLRNGGVEYVTNGAIAAKDVTEYVTRLRDTFIRHGVFVNPDAHRTSTHIHVNMTEDTMDTVLGTMLVFALFEPLFLRLCGPKRDGNAFCLSSYDTGDIHHYFNAFAKALDKYDRNGPMFPHRGKYSACNTGRLMDLGTLEFRCFPHSIDPAEIQQWVNWLMAIRELARNEQDRTFRTLMKQVLREPIYYSTNTFGYLSPDIVSEIPALIEYGGRTAYELSRVLKAYIKKSQKNAA